MSARSSAGDCAAPGWCVVKRHCTACTDVVALHSCVGSTACASSAGRVRVHSYSTVSDLESADRQMQVRGLTLGDSVS